MSFLGFNKIGMKKIIGISLGLCAVLVFMFFYQKNHSNRKPKSLLPYYGFDRFDTTMVDGQPKIDTMYHVVKDFSFINQHSDTITSNITKNKIYVADFFFVNCPGICVKMTAQMKRVFEAYKNNPSVVLLSHTVNPESDTPSVLLEYAQKQGVAKGNHWHFLTGSKVDLYNMAREAYYVTATQGDGGADDFVHTEKFVLVDTHKNIRGYYDGTNENDVNKLMFDMDKLLLETTTIE